MRPPANAQGIFFDVHSYSELVLWPWGYQGNTGNATELATFGRKLAWFNNYTPQRADDLYPTDGGTIDFAYGELGLASMVFELGTSFFQNCSTFENTILPDNLDALVYAAKSARAPYALPAGPDVVNLALSEDAVLPGSTVTLSAEANDTRFNNSNGTEPTQSIAAAEVYIDTPPWETGATAIALSASDGNLNSNTEGVTGLIDTTGLALGQHMLFVRAQDSAGNWGPVSARFLTVTDNPPVTVFFDDFETDLGWITNPGSNDIATTGTVGTRCSRGDLLRWSRTTGRDGI